jgi:hypothetical protein
MRSGGEHPTASHGAGNAERREKCRKLRAA